MRAVSLRWRDMPKLVTGRVISFPKWAGPRWGRPDARIEEERDGDGRVNDAPRKISPSPPRSIASAMSRGMRRMRRSGCDGLGDGTPLDDVN